VDEAHDAEVSRHEDFDIYRPCGAAGVVPAVVLVHGAAPPGRRPRNSPLYTGYAGLLAARGVAAVVPDVRYRGLEEWPAGSVWPPHADWEGTAHWLHGLVEQIRDVPGIDSSRLAVWAFSGAGMLTGSWLADSPTWLRCLALTYPVLADQTPDSTVPAPCELVRPGRAIVLTRVGRERPEYQATVDRLLERAGEVGAAVEVIDVSGGEHGFDAFAPELESLPPVITALDAVAKHLVAN
jgi:dienelactone hydrolase